MIKKLLNFKIRQRQLIKLSLVILSMLTFSALMINISNVKGSNTSKYHPDNSLYNVSMYGIFDWGKDIWDTIKNIKPDPGKPGTPSRNAFSVAGWYFKAGYSLQPRDKYVALPNQKVTIKTSILKNKASVISNKYTWNYSLNGKDWIPIDSNDENPNFKVDEADENLGVTLKERLFKNSSKKAIFFQQSAQVWPTYFNKPLWSNVAMVVPSDKEILTSKISIDEPQRSFFVDKDYKNQEYFFSASTIPAVVSDSDQIRWSGSNSIASVNPETGQLLINDQDLTGILTITASLPKRNIYSYPKNINIERIVEGNKPVKMNETLSLGINSSLQFDSKKYQIEWYKKTDDDSIPQKITKANSPNINIQKGNRIINLTINSEKLNGTKIFAKFKDVKPEQVKVPDKNGKPVTQTLDSSFESDPITIELINNGDRFTTKHTIGKITDNYPQSFIGTQSIDKVHVGDQISHRFTITDADVDSQSVSLTSVDFSLNVAPGETIKSIYANGENIQVRNPGKAILSFLLLTPSEDIEINTTINSITNSQYTYTPTIKVDDKDTGIQVHSTTAYFDDNSPNESINSHINTIHFDLINMGSKKIISRTYPKENEPIVTIEDNRSSKSPISVLVNYSGPFTNAPLNLTNNTKDIDNFTSPKKIITAPMRLGFFNDKNNEQIFANNTATLIPNKMDDNHYTIKWPIEEGLRLILLGFNIIPDTYHSTLTWSIRDVPNGNNSGTNSIKSSI